MGAWVEGYKELGLAWEAALNTLRTAPHGAGRVVRTGWPQPEGRQTEAAGGHPRLAVCPRDSRCHDSRWLCAEASPALRPWPCAVGAGGARGVALDPWPCQAPASQHPDVRGVGRAGWRCLSPAPAAAVLSLRDRKPAAGDFQQHAAQRAQERVPSPLPVPGSWCVGAGQTSPRLRVSQPRP